MKRWILPFFVALTLPAQAEGILVRVLHPQAVSSAVMVEGQGRVVLQKKNSLTAMSDGRVAKTFAGVGDPVKKGQLLILLENPEVGPDIASLKSKIALNRRSLVILQKKLQDANEMLKLGVMAKSDADSLKNDLYIKKMETAELEASLAKLLLRRGSQQIRSNVNGFLTSIVPEGSFLTYGAEAATILAPSNEQVEAQIPFERIREIKAGQEALLVANGVSERGRVLRTVPLSIANLVKVLIRPQRPLPLDLSVGVKLHVKASRGLMIPKSAVVLNEGKTVVYLLKGKKVEAKAIRVDRAEANRVFVQGLSPRDTVVVENAAILSDGAEVSVK